jgi:hypothetical protein
MPPSSGYNSNLNIVQYVSWRDNRDYLNLHLPCCENLKTQIITSGFVSLNEWVP